MRPQHGSGPAYDAKNLGKLRPPLRWQPRLTRRNGIVMGGIEVRNLPHNQLCQFRINLLRVASLDVCNCQLRDRDARRVFPGASGSKALLITARHRGGSHVVWRFIGSISVLPCSSARFWYVGTPTRAERRAAPQNKKGVALPRPLIPLLDEYLTSRLRDDPDVWPRRLPALRILLLGLFVRHRARNDDVLAVLPVNGSRDLVLGGELERVDHP